MGRAPGASETVAPKSTGLPQEGQKRDVPATSFRQVGQRMIVGGVYHRPPRLRLCPVITHQRTICGVTAKFRTSVTSTNRANACGSLHIEGSLNYSVIGDLLSSRGPQLLVSSRDRTSPDSATDSTSTITAFERSRPAADATRGMYGAVVA